MYFTGNPGSGNIADRSGNDMDRRLDDFWCLRIKRPAFGDMKRALHFLVCINSFCFYSSSFDE